MGEEEQLSGLTFKKLSILRESCRSEPFTCFFGLGFYNNREKERGREMGLASSPLYMCCLISSGQASSSGDLEMAGEAQKGLAHWLQVINREGTPNFCPGHNFPEPHSLPVQNPSHSPNPCPGREPNASSNSLDYLRSTNTAGIRSHSCAHPQPTSGSHPLSKALGRAS